jgi:hypothetical protein
MSQTLRNLTPLKTLELIETPFCPLDLAGLTNLQRLVVSYDEGESSTKCLLAAAHATVSPFEVLLGSVGKLTQLQAIKLVVHQALPILPTLPTVPSSAFAALTASSQLHELHVELSNVCCKVGEGIMPGSDVLQHIFSTGLYLEQLHSSGLGAGYRNGANCS